MNNLTNVRVKISNREYQVNCPEDQVESLITSAQYLDQKMQEIRGNSANMSIDRIAVLAGLNLAHELLQERHRATTLEEGSESRVNHLIDRVQGTLQRSRPEETA